MDSPENATSQRHQQTRFAPIVSQVENLPWLEDDLACVGAIRILQCVTKWTQLRAREKSVAEAMQGVVPARRGRPKMKENNARVRQKYVVRPAGSRSST